MSNNFYSPHPEDDELLSYSDGELEGSSVPRIRKHLKDCWRCRTQLEDLQATVVGFMRYRDHVLTPSLAAPPHSWKNLRPDFDRIDRENAALSAGSRMLARFGPIPMRISRIAVGLAALAVVGLSFGYLYVQRNESPVLPAALVAKPATKADAVPAVPSGFHPQSATTSASSAKARLAEQSAGSVNAEVEVALALHRVGADLGEPVEVLRDGGGVVVTGTAISASRRQELTAALTGIAGVSMRWEDTRMSRNPARPNASFDAGRLPWQSELETALGGKAALERTSNELLDLSEAVTARALALNKLQDRFSKATLNPADQAKIDAITTDHQKLLRRAIDDLAKHADPVFEKLGITYANTATGAAGTVLQAARRTDQLLNVLFAGADTDRSLPQIMEELKLAMARLGAAAQ